MNHLYSLIVAIFMLSPLNMFGGIVFEYWFDNSMQDIKRIDYDSSDVSFVIDASTCDEGYHTLHYRLQSSVGCYGPVLSSLFYVPAKATISVAGNSEWIYWLDDDFNIDSHIRMNGDSIQTSIDLSNLKEGYHFLNHYTVVNNAIGALHQNLIFKNDPAVTVDWCKIWWDDFIDRMENCHLESVGDSSFISKEIVVPDYVLEKKSIDSKARLNLLVGNSKGWVSDLLTAEIAYSSDVTSIKLVDNDDSGWKLERVGSELTATDLIPGYGILNIYDITGKCIYMERPVNDSMTLPSLSVGIYIISYGNISRKAMID